jgi:acyl-CoA thioester hydrolase
VSASPEAVPVGAAPVGGLSTRIQLRWADTDGYGHVNNVVWMRYLEEARIRLFGLPDMPTTATPGEPPVYAQLDSGCFTIIAGQRVEYVNELPYHGQVIVVEVWVSRVGGSTVDLSYRVTDEAAGTVYLIAQSTQAVREVATRAAHRFSERELEVLNAHLAAPHRFR